MPWQEKARYGTYLSLVRGAGRMVLELLLKVGSWQGGDESPHPSSLTTFH